MTPTALAWAAATLLAASPAAATSLKYLVNEEGYQVGSVQRDVSFTGCREEQTVAIGTTSFTCFRDVARRATGPAIMLYRVMPLAGREQMTRYFCPLAWEDCVSADPEPWPPGG